MRPDYCPIGNEPCQSLCDEPCSIKIKKALAQPTQQETIELLQLLGHIRVLKRRIYELEGELIGYKRIVDTQDLMLERQTARIVDLQTHIQNIEGQE